MTDFPHSYCFVLNLMRAVGQFSCSDVGRYFLAAFIFMRDTHPCFVQQCGNCSTLCSKQVFWPKSIQGSPGSPTQPNSLLSAPSSFHFVHVCVFLLLLLATAGKCVSFGGLPERYGSASLWESNFFSTCVLGCCSSSFSYLVSFGI